MHDSPGLRFPSITLLSAAFLLPYGVSKADGADSFFEALQNGKVTDYVTNKVQDFATEHLPSLANQPAPAFGDGFSSSLGQVAKGGSLLYKLLDGQMQVISQGMSDLSTSGSPDGTAVISNSNNSAKQWLQDTVKSYLPESIGKVVDTLQESRGLESYLNNKADSANSWMQEKFRNLSNVGDTLAAASQNLQSSLRSVTDDLRPSAQSALDTDAGPVLTADAVTPDDSPQAPTQKKTPSGLDKDAADLAADLNMPTNSSSASTSDDAAQLAASLGVSASQGSGITNWAAEAQRADADTTQWQEQQAEIAEQQRQAEQLRQQQLAQQRLAQQQAEAAEARREAAARAAAAAKKAEKAAQNAATQAATQQQQSDNGIGISGVLGAISEGLQGIQNARRPPSTYAQPASRTPWTCPYARQTAAWATACQSPSGVEYNCMVGGMVTHCN
jgi:hypothetical protein